MLNLVSHTSTSTALTRRGERTNSLTIYNGSERPLSVGSEFRRVVKSVSEMGNAFVGNIKPTNLSFPQQFPVPKFHSKLLEFCVGKQQEDFISIKLLELEVYSRQSENRAGPIRYGVLSHATQLYHHLPSSAVVARNGRCERRDPRDLTGPHDLRPESSRTNGLCPPPPPSSRLVLIPFLSKIVSIKCQPRSLGEVENSLPHPPPLTPGALSSHSPRS